MRIGKGAELKRKNDKFMPYDKKEDRTKEGDQGKSESQLSRALENLKDHDSPISQKNSDIEYWEDRAHYRV